MQKILNKYLSHIESMPPVRVAVIDGGCKTGSVDYNVIESFDLETKTAGPTVVSSHGDKVARIVSSLYKNKVEIVNLRVGTSHWHVLDALDKARELGCRVVNTSLAISQNTMIAANMERLRMNDIIWVSNYANSFNYPSYFLHSDIIQSFSSKFADFGTNIMVAIPTDESGKVSSGAYDIKIPSLGVVQNTPSWATAQLTANVAFIRQFDPNLSSKDVTNLLHVSSNRLNSNFGMVNLERAIEQLTGESLDSTEKPRTQSLIDHIEIHYTDGTIEVR